MQVYLKICTFDETVNGLILFFALFYYFFVLGNNYKSTRCLALLGHRCIFFFKGFTGHSIPSPNDNYTRKSPGISGLNTFAQRFPQRETTGFFENHKKKKKKLRLQHYLVYLVFRQQCPSVGVRGVRHKNLRDCARGSKIRRSPTISNKKK